MVVERHDLVQHSPGEMRRFSNVGHIIEGSLIGVGSALALKGAMDGSQETDAWPALTAATGLLCPAASSP